MEIERATELLNTIIDSVVENNGLNAHRAFDERLEMGFTRSELINIFGFTDEDEEEDDDE